MKCVNCNNSLKKTIFNNVEIDYCDSCLGIWFEQDELRQAKDEKAMKWMDIDLWKDESKFKLVLGKRICPKCSVPLYEMRYGDSDTMVDICNMCKGAYLDKGEFNKIIDYLKSKQAYEVYNHFFKNLAEQAGEMFAGPEGFKSEAADFWAILKLITLRYPAIEKVISALPK